MKDTMLIRLLLLFFYVHLIRGQWDSDLCVQRIQDGHSNEQDSISEVHCELYDRLHNNNQSTLQVIDLDGTIAGCWVYETENGETFYFNKNLNPSGMCSSPHFCVQYTECLTGGETPPDNFEILYIAPTPSPTTQSPTSEQEGINLSNVLATEEPTASPIREDPSFPTHTILIVATITLISIATILGFVATKTNTRADITYPSGV